MWCKRWPLRYQTLLWVLLIFIPVAPSSDYQKPIHTARLFPSIAGDLCLADWAKIVCIIYFSFGDWAIHAIHRAFFHNFLDLYTIKLYEYDSWIETFERKYNDTNYIYFHSYIIPASLFCDLTHSYFWKVQCLFLIIMKFGYIYAL